MVRPVLRIARVALRAVFFSASLLLASWAPFVLPAPTLYDVSVVEIAGRAGHQGLFTIQGQPIQGTNATVRVRLVGAAASVNLLVLDSSNKVLTTSTMVAPDVGLAVQGTYFAAIVVPTQPFKFSVAGVDASGVAFSVSHGPLLQPQTVSIRLIPAVSELSASLPNYITVQVENFGAQDALTVSLASDDGVAALPTYLVGTIPSRDTAAFSFQFLAPPGIGGLVTLRASASSNRSRSSGNTASLQIPVRLTADAKLIAEVDEEDESLSHRNTDVKICGTDLDPATITLANVMPLAVKPLPNNRDSERDRRGRSRDMRGLRGCAVSPLVATFDTTSLSDAAEAGGFPTSSRHGEAKTLLPVTAFSPSGTRLVGYVPVIHRRRENHHRFGGVHGE